MSAVASPPPKTKRRAFVFVCQAGELEIKALLLAASLRRFLLGDFDLIAALPTPAEIWGDISADTRAQLAALGASIVPIANPIDADYKIGNKLACIDVPSTAQRVVFLDSDMLCLRDLGDPEFLRVPFAAKPADLRTFAGGADAWRPLYRAVDVALPDLRLPTTVSGEFGLPYFNSGAIFVDNGLEFGRHWIDCARTLAREPTMREQRHWLDQVSLPLAVQRLRLPYAALDERFNFPAHLKTLAGQTPFFCHYHWPHIVRREPALLALVRELARANPVITRVMSGHDAWAKLLDDARPAAASVIAPQRANTPPPVILVAGIPASGGPELLRALERNGCNMLDDAPEVTSALAAAGPPLELAALCRSIGAGTSQPAQPPTIIAIGSELALLCRLDVLQRALPGARMIACVRNPFATIAEWKLRPQMFEGALAWVAAHGRRWLDPRPLAQFERVAAVADIAERRAAWWWWLAQRVLDHAGSTIIVRAQDLTADADGLARALIAGAEPDRDATFEAENAPEQAALDARDLQMIRAICLQAAADLRVAGG